MLCASLEAVCALHDVHHSRPHSTTSHTIRTPGQRGQPLRRPLLHLRHRLLGRQLQGRRLLQERPTRHYQQVEPPPNPPPLRRAAPRPPPAFSPTLPTYTPQPRCPPARHTPHRNGAPFFTTHSCKAQSDWDTCKDLHDGVKAAVSVRALPHSPARTPIQSTTLPHPLLMCARPTLGLYPPGPDAAK